MTGPLGAIWQVVNTGTLGKKVSVPLWVVLLSAGGLVVGLATYGYNVTRAVGTRMAKLTPSRGFAAELATSLVILVASQYGLPTSSSQCITGGVIGVALCEGTRGLNWRFLMKTFCSWISTLALVAMITAALFSQAVYAPSIPAGKAVAQYEAGIGRAAADVFGGYADALQRTGFDLRSGDALARNLVTTRKNVDMLRTGSMHTVRPWQALGYLDTALSLSQQTLGVNASSPAVCPALLSAACGAAPMDALPAPASLTSRVYGVTAPPLDARLQGGGKACSKAPCNAALAPTTS